MAAQSPGSYVDFQTNHPDLSGAEAFKAYDAQLSAYRTSRAQELGLSLQDLHDGGFNKVVDLTVQIEEVEVA
jgi:hypothetical protein